MSSSPWHEPLEPSYSEDWGDESITQSDSLDDVSDDEHLIDSSDISQEVQEELELEEEELEEEEYQEEIDLDDIEEDEEFWNYS